MSCVYHYHRKKTKQKKLRHQGIRFSLQYKKGITNPADYFSQHGIPWEKFSKNEKNESADLTNLLYTLHVTRILNTIEIKEIARENNTEPTLKDLRDLTQSGKLHIPNDKPHLTPYKQIISEITILQF